MRLLIVVFLFGAELLSAGAAGAQTLPSLIADTLAQHPVTRSQSQLVLAAQAQLEGARWQHWPTPYVSVEKGYSDQSGGLEGNKAVTTLGLRQTLWAGGRLTANVGRAQARLAIAQADMESARQQLALRVIQSWSDSISAQSTLRAHQRSRVVHERLLAMVMRREAEGLSSQADVTLAQARLEMVLSDIDNATNRLNMALLRLQSLVGHRVSAETVYAAPVPLDVSPGLSFLLEQAQQQSPQIGRARAQAELSRREVEFTRASMLPELYARMERQYGPSGLFSSRKTQNRVFIGLSTSLGPGLSTLSAVDAANASSQAADEDIESQQLALQEQIGIDLDLLKNSVRRRTVLERSSRYTTAVSASWERQFLAGRKQWQDLMNAAREQVQVDMQLADLLGLEQLVGWRLKLYTQGLASIIGR